MQPVSCGSGCTYYRGRKMGAFKERTDREACLQQVMALKKQAQEKERQWVANWKKRPNKRNGRDLILISCQHIYVIGQIIFSKYVSNQNPCQSFSFSLPTPLLFLSLSLIDLKQKNGVNKLPSPPKILQVGIWECSLQQICIKAKNRRLA